MKWRKSTKCGASNTCVEVSSYSNKSNCVEIADIANGVHIRDSTRPSDPQLVLSGMEWRSLLNTIKEL